MLRTTRQQALRRALVVVAFLLLCLLYGYWDTVVRYKPNIRFGADDGTSTPAPPPAVPDEKPVVKPKPPARVNSPKFRPASPPSFSTVMPKISTFAALIAGSGLDISAKSGEITIFAPVNAAMYALNVEPDEGPPDMKFEGALKGVSPAERKRVFTTEWINSHIVPIPQYAPVPGNESTSSSLNTLHIETPDGRPASWDVTTVNGARILYKVTTDTGGQLYVVSECLLDWEKVKGPFASDLKFG